MIVLTNKLYYYLKLNQKTHAEMCKMTIVVNRQYITKFINLFIAHFSFLLIICMHYNFQNLPSIFAIESDKKKHTNLCLST